MFRAFMLAAGIMMAATAANAATLDFTVLPFGDVGSPTASVPGATITNNSGFDLYRGDQFANSICALSATFNCNADLTLDFDSLVSNITFDSGGFDPGDFVEVSVLGIADMLLGSFTIAGDTHFVLSGFNNVSKLVFDDSSTGFGLVYGNFTYDVAAVPLPAGLPLFVTGLGGIALLRRRRRA